MTGSGQSSKLKYQQIAVLETTAKKDPCSNFCYQIERELLASSIVLSLHVSYQMCSTAITQAIGAVVVNGICCVLVMKQEETSTRVILLVISFDEILATIKARVRQDKKWQCSRRVKKKKRLLIKLVFFLLNSEHYNYADGRWLGRKEAMKTVKMWQHRSKHELYKPSGHLAQWCSSWPTKNLCLLHFCCYLRS